jgi:hypothetical protein
MITIMFTAIDDLWKVDARRRSLMADEALFRAGDPVQSLYWVESGTVRLIRPLTHGFELIMQRVRPQPTTMTCCKLIVIACHERDSASEHRVIMVL